MLMAKDVMTKDVITIKPDASLEDAIKLLLMNRISGMPVIADNGEMVGIISEKDMLNFAFNGNLHWTKVEEAMTKKVISFPTDKNVELIALDICQNNIRRVPIVEKGKVVGIVSRHDIIRAVLPIGVK